MSYVGERGTNAGWREDGETKMREIDGSNERKKGGREKDREESEMSAKDVEIKRGTEEDCEGVGRGEGRG